MFSDLADDRLAVSAAGENSVISCASLVTENHDVARGASVATACTPNRCR